MDELHPSLPTFLCLSGSMKGSTLAPNDPRVVLGSESGCDVQFSAPKDHVEKRHAVIENSEAGWVIRSLSKKPVYVNGSPAMEGLLGEGDVVKVGQDGPELQFRLRQQRRVTKTLSQIVTDSRTLSRRDRKGTRRATTFARQFVYEAIRNSDRKMRIWFGVLGLCVLVMGGLLAFNMFGTREAQRRSEDLEQQNAKLREDLDAGKRDRERLSEALGAAGKDREKLVGQLEKMVNREAALDSILKDLSESSARALTDINALRGVTNAARDIHARYHRGVGFILLGISFYDESQQKFVRYRIDPLTGKRDTKARIPVRLGGKGAKLMEWVSGSGFLVSDDGLMISNRHVIDPWYSDKSFGGGLLEQKSSKFRAVRESFFVCFPGRKEPIPLTRVGVHPTKDIAVVRLKAPDSSLPVLRLAKESPGLPGTKTVLIGYPEGVRGIVNKLESDTAKQAMLIAKGDRRAALVEVISRLGGISPTLTQGVLSDVNREQLTYDAVTYSGGSGGPLFTENGEVIGVNTAISRNFTGANYGLPVALVRDLLTQGPFVSEAIALPEMPRAKAVEVSGK